MNAVLQIASGLLLIAGATFSLLAAIGVLRFPDFYTRMHAASKAGTAGAGLALIAIACHSGDAGVATRAVAGIVFLFMTAPISAHLLARAAFLAGYRPLGRTRIDPRAAGGLAAASKAGRPRS